MFSFPLIAWYIYIYIYIQIIVHHQSTGGCSQYKDGVCVWVCECVSVCVCVMMHDECKFASYQIIKILQCHLASPITQTHLTTPPSLTITFYPLLFLPTHVRQLTPTNLPCSPNDKYKIKKYWLISRKVWVSSNMEILLISIYSGHI